MTRWFDILNNFKGFGNPEGKIWFFGIEESGEWSPSPEKDKEKYDRYSKGYFWNEEGEDNPYSSVYNIISMILIGLGLGSGNIDEYRKKILFKETSGVFQANLYPLAKPQQKKWPKYYKDIFGYSASEKKQYQEYVRKNRFPELRDFWKKHNPLLTICFGSTFWDDFKSVFHLKDMYLEKKLDEGYIEIYGVSNNLLIVLTPFFSYRKYCMPEERIKRLINYFKKNLLFNH